MKQSDIERALSRMTTPPARDREDFWSDFRARARLHPQWHPVRESALPRLAPWLAFVCTVLVAALVLFPFGNGESKASEVLSVDILAQHSGVMIMNEEASQGTILWVCDMETETGGDST